MNCHFEKVKKLNEQFSLKPQKLICYNVLKRAGTAWEFVVSVLQIFNMSNFTYTIIHFPL